MSDSDAPVTVAQVGCGYWGPNLLRNLNALSATDVRLVVDPSPERRAFVKNNYPKVEVGESAQQAFDSDVQAVIISTPAATHGTLVRHALEAGKDVFVEKPLSLETKEAAELARLARDKGRILMVGHTFLFNAAVRDLKRRIDAGELGKIYYLYSQRLNLGIVRSDINASWNLAPHDVSIGRYLLDADPVSVSAQGVRSLQGPGLEDVVFMTLNYPNDVVMHVHVSWLDPNKTRQMTVVGDKKMIVYDDVSDDKVRIYDKGITKEERVPVEQPSDYARFRMIKRAGDLLIPSISFSEPLREEMKHFAECVAQRKTPITDAESGVAVTAVLEAVDRSLAQSGAPMPVEIPKI